MGEVRRSTRREFITRDGPAWTLGITITAAGGSIGSQAIHADIERKYPYLEKRYDELQAKVPEAQLAFKIHTGNLLILDIRTHALDTERVDELRAEHGEVVIAGEVPSELVCTHFSNFVGDSALQAASIQSGPSVSTDKWEPNDDNQLPLFQQLLLEMDLGYGRGVRLDADSVDAVLKDLPIMFLTGGTAFLAVFSAARALCELNGISVGEMSRRDFLLLVIVTTVAAGMGTLVADMQLIAEGVIDKVGFEEFLTKAKIDDIMLQMSDTDREIVARFLETDVLVDLRDLKMVNDLYCIPVVTAPIYAYAGGGHIGMVPHLLEEPQVVNAKLAATMQGDIDFLADMYARGLNSPRVMEWARGYSMIYGPMMVTREFAGLKGYAPNTAEATPAFTMMMRFINEQKANILAECGIDLAQYDGDFDLLRRQIAERGGAEARERYMFYTRLFNEICEYVLKDRVNGVFIGSLFGEGEALLQLPGDEFSVRFEQGLVSGIEANQFAAGVEAVPIPRDTIRETVSILGSQVYIGRETDNPRIEHRAMGYLVQKGQNVFVRIPWTKDEPAELPALKAYVPGLIGPDYYGTGENRLGRTEELPAGTYTPQGGFLDIPLDIDESDFAYYTANTEDLTPLTEDETPLQVGDTVAVMNWGVVWENRMILDNFVSTNYALDEWWVEAVQAGLHHLRVIKVDDDGTVVAVLALGDANTLPDDPLFGFTPNAETLINVGMPIYRVDGSGQPTTDLVVGTWVRHEVIEVDGRMQHIVRFRLNQ